MHLGTKNLLHDAKVLDINRSQSSINYLMSFVQTYGRFSLKIAITVWEPRTHNFRLSGAAR